MKKTIPFTIALALSASASVFSFDWPQQEVLSEHFFSYFGQLRGGTIGTSLVFADTESVKSVENGKKLVVIEESDNFFPSTLGNAVILQHEDNIQTIYANLDKDSYPENFDEKEDFSKGDLIGQTSNSGWQEKNSALEFKVIDTKKHSVINPRILLPRIGKENELLIKMVTAVAKNGSEYRLALQKSFDSGTYLLYRERQSFAMPYKTVVMVNGAVTDSISYDVLFQEKNQICVSGHRKYDVKTVYPDSNHHLLGEVTLPKGRVQIRIILIDILGNETTATYAVDVK